MTQKKRRQRISKSEIFQTIQAEREAAKATQKTAESFQAESPIDINGIPMHPWNEADGVQSTPEVTIPDSETVVFPQAILPFDDEIGFGRAAIAVNGKSIFKIQTPQLSFWERLKFLFTGKIQ
jgi:hypothetical protein